MKRRIAGGAAALAMIASLAGCAQTEDASAKSASAKAEAAASAPAADRDTLYQVSLLQGLTLGDYHGSVPVKDLKDKGDIGIGTFDGLNGELVMVDGTVYQALGDGTVKEAEDAETIPFAAVTFLDEDESEQVENVASFDDLRALLDEKVKELGPNRFYMARMDGHFDTMNVRSEKGQSEPYEPMVTVMDRDQTFFDYEDVDGAIVALYCPAYMSELNAAPQACSGQYFSLSGAQMSKGAGSVRLTRKMRWPCSSSMRV